MIATRIHRQLGLLRSAEVGMLISAGKGADNGIYDKQIRFGNELFFVRGFERTQTRVSLEVEGDGCVLARQGPRSG